MSWKEKLSFHQSFGSLPWNGNTKLCAGHDRERETFYPILQQQNGMVKIPEMKNVFSDIRTFQFVVMDVSKTRKRCWQKNPICFYFFPKYRTQQRRNLLEEQGRECSGTTRGCARLTREESIF